MDLKFTVRKLHGNYHIGVKYKSDRKIVNKELLHEVIERALRSTIPGVRDLNIGPNRVSMVYRPDEYDALQGLNANSIRNELNREFENFFWEILESSIDSPGESLIIVSLDMGDMIWNDNKDSELFDQVVDFDREYGVGLISDTAEWVSSEYFGVTVFSWAFTLELALYVVDWNEFRVSLFEAVYNSDAFVSAATVQGFYSDGFCDWDTDTEEDYFKAVDTYVYSCHNAGLLPEVEVIKLAGEESWQEKYITLLNLKGIEYA